MFNDKLFVHVSPFFGVPVMDGDVGHRAEGHKGRSQAGAKGHQLEVGPQRGSRLLVSDIIGSFVN